MNIEMPRKKLDLSSAIAEGDIRVLLMVLVHMTGDERWLEPPYKPRRESRRKFWPALRGRGPRHPSNRPAIS